MSAEDVVCTVCGDGVVVHPECSEQRPAIGGASMGIADCVGGGSASSGSHRRVLSGWRRERTGSQDQHEASVPSFFRKDRHPIQTACVIGFALSYSTSEKGQNLFEYLGHLCSSAKFAHLPGSQSLAGIIARALPTWVHVLIVVVVMAISIWEATRFPRFASHGTPLNFVRTLLQMQGDLLLAPLRLCLPGEQPLLDFQHTTQNERILAMCPSLQKFKQTPWLHNSLMSFVVLMLGDVLYGAASVKNVRREQVTAADGGAIALDWWEPDSLDLSVRPRKILFVGSTFTGDALVTVTREVCEYFTALGWRCVVHVKRGCGMTMPNEQPPTKSSGDGPVKPWCLSGLDDIELGIDHVAALHPDAVICGIGLSTGGGQLRNYVNLRGRSSKLAAAVMVDAAPFWGPAMESIDRNLPLVAKALVSAARFSFHSAGQPDPCAEAKGASAACGAGQHLSGGMLDFIERQQAPAHGFPKSREGMQQYFESCQPADASGCAVPVLELLTYNDTLITPEMQDVNRKAAQRSPHTIVATTHEGTHMVRWEGMIPQCWIRRASGEFLEAALRVAGRSA